MAEITPIPLKELTTLRVGGAPARMIDAESRDELIAVLLHKGNVSYEIHGWSPKYLTPALKKEIRGRLQDRVMFGSDFPALSYERVVGDWIAEGYSDAVLEKLFFRNAEAYFGLR